MGMVCMGDGVKDIWGWCAWDMRVKDIWGWFAWDMRVKCSSTAKKRSNILLGAHHTHK